MALCLFCLPTKAETAKDLTLPLLIGPQLDGTHFELKSQRGKVVIVSFWATWCGPCRQEMPIFDEALRKYGSQRLVVVGVSMDLSRKREEVIAFMKSYSFPALLIEETSVNDFGEPSVLPVAYLIDKSGKVRGIFSNQGLVLTRKSLEEALLPLL